MSISRSVVVLFAAVAALSTVAHCAAVEAGGTCLRYSDCDQGLTCSAGHCVAVPQEGGEEGDAGDASVVDGAFEGSTSTADDAGADAADAAKGADSAVDAGAAVDAHADGATVSDAAAAESGLDGADASDDG